MYNSKTISKLINNIMLDGKKGIAQNILYDAFKKVKKKLGMIQLWKSLNKQLKTLCQYLKLK